MNRLVSFAANIVGVVTQLSLGGALRDDPNRTDQNRTDGMREDNVKPKECYGTLVLMIEYHFSN